MDNKPFLAGLGQAEGAVRGFSATGSQALGGISKLLGGSLLLGFGALGLAIKSTADKFDELGDTADNLGIATDKLQELAAAADDLGSSSEQLTTLLTKMQKTIGDAANGNAGAIESFERIGLSVKDLIGLNPDEQFKKIGSAIAELRDKNLQAASATELLGKQGSKSLTFLTADLNKATESSSKWGVVSSENVQVLGELSNKFKELGRGFSSMFGGLLAIASPILNMVIKQFTIILDTMNATVRVSKELIGFAKDLAGVNAYNPNDRQDKFIVDQARFGGAAVGMSQFSAAYASSIGNRAGGVVGNAVNPSNFKDVADSFASRTQLLSTTFERLSSAVDKAKSTFENFAQRMEQLGVLRDNRYDDYKGRPQLDSQEFDDIARELIDKQLGGNLSNDYARSQLGRLKDITTDNLQYNTDTGNIDEFSTANLKNDLKQLQELLLGNKGKNEIAITVQPSEEFETKIIKISENNFTSILTKEATSVNR